METKPLLSTYLPVWEQKMEKIKKLISIEIHKPKKERKKHQLKLMLIECKDLKRIIKSIKRETIKFCPNCKHEIVEH